ncbi:MAG: hypothetical protein J6U87_06805, partial [Clostridia bacterium]|nr:hypothetical protein [Clostridia bacterium]
KSNLVVCEIDGRIEAMDINYALVADRYFKKTLKPGNMESLTPEQQQSIKELADKRYDELCELYSMVKVTSK